MREVEIGEDGLLEDTEHLHNLRCPVISLDRGKVGTCWTGCAWFAMKNPLYPEQHPITTGDHAYCKDHCIGKIKEPDNG